MTERQTKTPEIELRRLASGEAELHRAVRLAALADAPDAFHETLAAVEAWPDAYWDELTASVTAAGRHAMFVTLAGTAPIGCVYALLDGERSDTARVGGMWVHPDWRRYGIGARLLDAVVDWGRSRGRSRTALWVATEAGAAGALYRRAGFRPTGGEMPIRDGASALVVELVRV